MLKIRKLLINVLAALVFGVLLLSPVVAQQWIPVTPEPTPAPVEVVVEAPTEVVPDGSVVLPIWQLLAVAVGFFLSGGAVSVFGLGMLADKIRNDPVALKNAESVGNSVPAETANKLIDGIDSMTKILALFKEALDRVPAETKLQQQE